MSLFILLSRSPDNPASSCRRTLAEAGFAVVDHVLGSSPSVEFGSVLVAIIEVGTRVDSATAQTKRWRAELGDDLVPIVWIMTDPELSQEKAARGLDAGADVVVWQPLEDIRLIAQVRAAARMRTIGIRVATRANETRLLGEQLQKAYRQLDRELDASRRIQQAFLPQSFPTIGAARFAVSHRSRSRVGGDIFDVRVLDENRIGFFLGDIVECGTAGSLIGVFACQSVVMKKLDGSGQRVVAPGDVLSQLNRDLLGLGLEDRPLVAMLVAILNVQTGETAVARAGLPAPVHVPEQGEPRAWTVPGPFLGTADASYPTITATLRPGEKLVMGTDGIRPEGDPVPGQDTVLIEAISRHRNLSGQGFVDAVAQDLLTQIQHSDDFTLLCVEQMKG
jgi:serine phosphatase RsbU (regulator of sigma subunit)